MTDSIVDWPPPERKTWAATIPNEQWERYLEAIHRVRKTGARFLLGGAFGLASYTQRWRNTKDLDLFVLPSDKDRVIDAVTKAGFEDYHDQLPYDRGWIYRAVRDGVIVDTIWQTPNRRSEVDEEWFARARPVVICDEHLQAIPAEELLAIKLYVLQRDRCDWPDLINLLFFTAETLDWQHVLRRLDQEKPLLGGLLQVFNWIAPARAMRIPSEIRTEFHLSAPSGEDLFLPEDFRIKLIDSRPWFAAHQPSDRPMCC
jgi:hypothetical protein